ncbi:MAG: prepilin-type N-terminal cleavage/methylation domain-containing protein [Candidatus Dojkabacteria bacterium]|nr:MAG: prepilin-type N-terminal cleavage/methylation domain-containing protein [Candidatus Dojkabacteria bacterium]
MNRKYKGFTLVEMLIVMGILAILMVLGITVGRFAIQRANRIAHQGAVDQIDQAMQAYYTVNRKYPSDTECASMSTLMTDETNCLGSFVEGGWDGGSEATYYYTSDSISQSFLVCVSIGGIDDELEEGFYCSGNAWGESDAGADSVTTKDVGPDDAGAAQVTSFPVSQDWDGSAWGSGASIESR